MARLIIQASDTVPDLQVGFVRALTLLIDSGLDLRWDNAGFDIRRHSGHDRQILPAIDCLKAGHSPASVER